MPLPLKQTLQLKIKVFSFGVKYVTVWINKQLESGYQKDI